MVLWNYYYFASEDYEQCPQKTWYVAKCGILGGSLYTTWWLLYNPGFPQTAAFVSARWARYTVPITAAVMLGSASSCIIARMRGNKDDCWNYIAGFMLTTPIWTVKFRNQGYGTTMAAFMALVASAIKMYDKNDASLTAQVAFGRKIHYGSFGGENSADIRWMTPGMIYKDPGRRPPY